MSGYLSLGNEPQSKRVFLVEAEEYLPMKNLKWKPFIFRTFLFLTAEICLTPLGLDDLADYSEFLYERNEIALIC